MSNIKAEMLSVDDFDEYCRTCSSKHKLKSLYDNIETLSMLESFTQMQFSKTDELPDKICADCLTKIHDCYHFINNCKIIDEEFRKCLHNNLKQLELKTNELHSSIDIEEEDPLKLPTETEKPELQESPELRESNENTKEINVKQSEYYILKWGSPSENQENQQKFEFTAINNTLNEQDLIEQTALRRLQAMNRMKRLRTRFLRPAGETRTVDYEKKIPTFNVIGMDEQKISDHETLDRRATVYQQTNTTVYTTNPAVYPANPEDSHHPRAKLTLPHPVHNVIIQRKNETPERIALRRAFAREQMRKYRNKLTAEETAENRCIVTDTIRKYRVKIYPENGDNEPHRRAICSKPEKLPKPQIPLRLSEMARTLLQNDPLKTTKPPQPPAKYLHESGEISRFSLRPTKIPQVKKDCYETRLHVNNHQHQMAFRTWKRCNETPEEVTIRLAKTALQRKRMFCSTREPGQVDENAFRRANKLAGQVEESALRRAKAAGQIRQYRPMLRKNKTNEPHIQTGK